MPDSTTTLILRLTCSWVSVVGYGNVYRGRIRQVLSGNFPQKEITITLLAGDKQKEAFMSAHRDTVEFEMGCHQEGSNALYPMLPISGFVDENMNCWQIDYLKEVAGHNLELK